MSNAERKAWTTERITWLRNQLDAGRTNKDIAHDLGVTPELVSWAKKKFIVGNHEPSAQPHGMSSTPVYKLWWGMICRCKHPVTNSYAAYGGRGIKVCDRWLKFDRFYEDMGAPPEGASIDRVDPDGDYTPENCRWVTRQQQSRNKRTNVRVAYSGKQFILADLCREFGVTATHVYRYIRKGWTHLDAVIYLASLKEKRNAKNTCTTPQVHGGI